MKRLQEQDFEKIYELLEASFPKEEYREKEAQKAIFVDSRYMAYGYENDKNQLISFIGTWKLEGFYYIEHLASAASMRNTGIGTNLLQEFLTMCKLPVLLEVECPTGELEKRRIAFYERNGFHYNAYDYLQPPFRKGDEMFPLCIMSYSAPITKAAFEHFKKEVYRVVYQYEEV